MRNAYARSAFGEENFGGGGEEGRGGNGATYLSRTAKELDRFPSNFVAFSSTQHAIFHRDTQTWTNTGPRLREIVTWRVYHRQAVHGRRR